MLKLESVNTDLSLSIEHDHEIAAVIRIEHIAAKIHSKTMTMLLLFQQQLQQQQQQQQLLQQHPVLPSATPDTPI